MTTSAPRTALGSAASQGPQSRAALRRLGLGAIRPTGWLRDQLQLQAQHITGHLEEIWADVGPNSAWLGGDGEDWERGPYYLDGLVALAHVLGDERLQAKAAVWIDAILGSQREDGWFGPASNDDWWPRMVAVKVLTQHAEATDDDRVIPFLTRYFRYQLQQLPDRPLTSWGWARGADNTLAVHWLHDRTGEDWLLELAQVLNAQTLDWGRYLTEDLITGKATQFDHHTHGPNVAMGLKTDAVRFLTDGEPERRDRTSRALAELDRWHGQVHGWFSGDEWLGGRDAVAGVETCQVVEMMFTLETLAQIFGDARWGDDLESLAFNLLPASSDPEMRGHQYLQQANQVRVSVDRRPWSFSGDDANIFGLEPNFGCCTANLHQGWPKFVDALWMHDAADGLVAIAYGPASIRTTLGGTPVALSVTTDYPFEQTVRVLVDPDEPVEATVSLRIPAWCPAPELQINLEPADVAVVDGYVRITRTWRAGDEVELTLPAEPRIVRRDRQAVGVRLGPLQLVYSPGENWREVPGAPGIGEWTIEARGSWNHALILPADPAVWSVQRSAPGPVPFAPRTPAVRLRVGTLRVPSWRLDGGNTAGPPDGPVSEPSGVMEIDLVPYGNARIRIAEMPVVATDRNGRIAAVEP